MGVELQWVDAPFTSVNCKIFDFEAGHLINVQKLTDIHEYSPAHYLVLESTPIVEQLAEIQFSAYR